MLGELRAAHAKGQKWCGIDIQAERVADNMEGCIWEPALVKEVFFNSSFWATNKVIFGIKERPKPRF